MRKKLKSNDLFFVLQALLPAVLIFLVSACSSPSARKNVHEFGVGETDDHGHRLEDLTRGTAPASPTPESGRLPRFPQQLREGLAISSASGPIVIRPINMTTFL